MLADGSLKLAIFAIQKYHFYLRFFIELAYNGKSFHGWQIQPNAKSIQQFLNEALSTVTRSEIYTIGCGRTDAGVHATKFFAHFCHGISSRKRVKVYDECATQKR